MDAVFEIGRHPLETKHGSFELIGHLFGDGQQVALTIAKYSGRPDDRPWLLRVQYGCVNATAFQATDCDCGSQIDGALRRISEYGKGALIYFRDHEAFGLGLAEKIRIVSEEKKRGLTFQDVLRAENVAPPKNDVMWVVPKILADLAISKDSAFIFLSGSIEKRRSLEREGVVIDSVAPV